MSRPPASLTRSLAQGTPTSPPAEPVEVSLPLRVAVVVIAGAALGLSWEPYGLWPLLLLGVPAFTLAVRGLRPLVASGLGYLFGLIMLTLAISWVHVLGTWIAVLLIIFMALYFGVLGLALALVSRLRWWPLAAACCWVLIEYTYSRIPFGGFGWTRIGYAAVEHRWPGSSRSSELRGFLRCGPARPACCLDRPHVVDRATEEAGANKPRGHRHCSGRHPRPHGSALRLYQVEPAVSTAGSVRVGIVQGNIPGAALRPWVVLDRSPTTTCPRRFG